MRRAPQVMGGLTALYGVLSLLRPALLARQLRLANPDGTAPPALAILSRVIGARDLGSGLAMVVAPRGRKRAAAIALRCAFDLTDAASFGRSVDPKMRRTIWIVAGGWAALCAGSGLASAVSRSQA